VAAVVEAVEAAAPDQPPALVGHSGAGVLLPAVRAALRRPVAGYVFVDAGLPSVSKSRLDLFDDPVAAAEFRRSARNGLLPTWTDEDLAEEILDPALRRRFVAELQPLPLAVYEELIPVFDGWPDAPCGYIQFSPVYDAPAAEARAAGWPMIQVPGTHFEMMRNPTTVTEALLRLKEELSRP